MGRGLSNSRATKLWNDLDRKFKDISSFTLLKTIETEYAFA